MTQHLQVERRIGAVRHRPEQRIGIVGIDVVVDGDDVFAGGAMQRGRAVQRAPDLRRRHAALQHQHDHLAQIGQRLVHRDLAHAADAERVAQMRRQHRLQRHALHQARFDGVTCEMIEVRIASLPPRDAGHVHEGVHLLQIDVAVRFAERRLGLEPFGVDEALDHDLGLGRNEQIDGLGAHHVDRASGEAARHRQLLHRLGQFLRRR